MHCSRPGLVAATLVLLFAADASAQRIRIPRRHDKPPGPALSPQDAVKKMTVPPGFSVEVVAAEPDLVNPVAMTIMRPSRGMPAMASKAAVMRATRGR